MSAEQTNLRHKTNVFEAEVILSEKEKMRKMVAENAVGIKDVIQHLIIKHYYYRVFIHIITSFKI